MMTYSGGVYQEVASEDRAAAGSDTEELAKETAEHLVTAYQLQDELEPLNTMAEKRADPRAEDAYGHMAAVYQREFSTLDDAVAAYMGRKHMDALFEQDIIENDPDNATTADVLEDVRWYTNVYPHLQEMCDVAGMDRTYADDMTRFFRDHGQQVDGWEDHARSAHTTKITYATGDASLAQGLADYFVDGVKYHDEGTASAWEEAGKLITKHYKNLLPNNGLLG